MKIENNGEVKEMLFNNSAINIKFPKTENIKKKYILNSDILSEKFNEATVLPIPDEAPNEIPRILIKSKGEHSQVNISPEAVSLETVYSDEYVKKWSLCEKYINSRVDDLMKLTERFSEGTYNYIGVVVNLFFDDIPRDGNKVLFRNLFGKEAKDTLDDLEVKYTYVENEKYYVNIILRSAKQFDDSLSGKAGDYNDDNLKLHTIVATIDINDRYSYNSFKGYVSKKENFKEIMDLVSMVINTKMGSLIERGDY